MDTTKAEGIMAEGLTAYRREGGSITVYQPVGGAHVVYVDTLDYEQRIKQLERENSKLLAQKELMQHRIEIERERADQRHDNQLMLYRALRDHAPEVAKELMPKLASNITETDKMMSERSRLLGIIERAQNETTHWIIDTDADWQAGYRDIARILGLDVAKLED